MNGPNIIKTIENNIPDYIGELEQERTRIITRLLQINRELVTAYSLSQLVPTTARSLALVATS